MTTRGAILFLAALLAFAQTGRDAYRDAYKSWKQADPALERDAASAGPSLGADADRVANQASKYGAERIAFLTQAAAAKERALSLLDQPSPDIGDVPDGATEVLAAETAAVRRSINTFTNDPDPGLQQLRGLLEKENAALQSLSSSVANRQKTADAARAAAEVAEQARIQAIPAGKEAVAGLKQAAEESTRETAAWAEYYRTLSDGARGILTTPASPTGNPTSIPLAPLERRPSITPLPLGRYTGAWTFPLNNGLFHGPAPEFLDMVVHEQDGHADGTLFGRFKVPSGDPVLRFDFSGDFQNLRTQKFDLKTSDGATGTIELIPGAAFNLLEINFQIDPTPGKIHQGNVVLVKK